MFRNRQDASAGGEPDASVYERALGDRFAALDPRLRLYFGRIPEGFEGVGEGVFHQAGLRVRALRPLFMLLGRWGVAFPDRGESVPFTLRNTPAPGGALDGVRTFFFPTATREMSDRMGIVRGRLIDRVGSRGRVEVELDLVVADGELTIESRSIALRAAGARLPLPPFVRIAIHERPADGERGTQHVDVRMIAPLFGEIYGYCGSFTYALQRVPGAPRLSA